MSKRRDRFYAQGNILPIPHSNAAYAGTKKFREGTRWGALGDIGELFVKKETFDVYYCPRCGRWTSSSTASVRICVLSEDSEPVAAPDAAKAAWFILNVPPK